MVDDDFGLSGSENCSAGSTGTTNEWSCTTGTIGTAGLYNVQVSGEDRGSAVDTFKGKSDLTKDGLKTSGAILFEVDKGVAGPDFLPADDGSTDNPDVFIIADYASEGMEYPVVMGDKDAASGPADNDKADVDADSHGSVTLMEATFNGDDVTDAVNSRDNVLFSYRPGGLSVGDHKLTIKVSDNAGNEKTSTLEFAVTARQAFKLPINPGANLVSFPGDPVDGSIDAVFGGDSDITTVVTFNNASGLWMTATRGGNDDSFSGDLTMVDGDHGYWVVSNGAADLSVVLVRSGGISVTPAAIPVVEGWNLVPVADALQQTAGTGIESAVYFGNIDADVAYGYDSIKGVLTRIDIPSTGTGNADSKDDNVMVGSGYWVYANKAGVIIP